ncbi:MAG: uracil-DNA glycosylase [Thermodesulfobacteriota bacterium]
MEKEVVRLLHDIRGLLACHQVSGIDNYPAGSELSSFLEARMPETGRPGESQGAKEKPAVGVQPATQTFNRKNKKSDQTTLGEIAAEVAQCRSCSLGGQRSRVVPGRGGGGNIRLFLIGHWLPESEQSGGESVFGVEEDQMLARMLAAIHLPMDQVFVTNVIKCGVGPDSQPQAEHVDACASYLRRQIAAVAPELICTMGMVATRALLRMSQPLSRLRGRFYSYQLAKGQEIPLLPTFHPSYLLQNPEMKKATWLDLQALEKRLQD